MTKRKTDLVTTDNVKTLVKSTKAQLNQRVSEVQALQMEGRTRSYIIQHGSKWDVSDRQIDDYIKYATTITKEVNLDTLQDNMGVIINNLWKLYRASNSSGDVKNAHAVLMSIAKLKGLDQQTLNINIEDRREFQDLSDSDLDAILVEKSSSNGRENCF